jgi:protein phosphatase 1L
MNIRYGVAETIGRRNSMEDAHSVKYSEELGVFSAEVYDGHSGSLAAVIAAETLTPFFLGTAHNPPDNDRFSPNRFSAEALREAYLATDRYIIGRGTESGAAAAGLYLRDEAFIVANAGDVRIVIGEGRNATTLTVDHKPDVPEERARIEAQGGVVVTLDVARVQGSLAMSRSLGDAGLKPFVTAEPRVTEGRLGRKNDVAILACDGLWDVVTPKEAVAVARSSSQPEEAANRLLALATTKGSTDNITVIVLDLKAYTANCERKRLRLARVLDQALPNGLSGL